MLLHFVQKKWELPVFTHLSPHISSSFFVRITRTGDFTDSTWLRGVRWHRPVAKNEISFFPDVPLSSCAITISRGVITDQSSGFVSRANTRRRRGTFQGMRLQVLSRIARRSRGRA